MRITRRRARTGRHRRPPAAPLRHQSGRPRSYSTFPSPTTRSWRTASARSVRSASRHAGSTTPRNSFGLMPSEWDSECTMLAVTKKRRGMRAARARHHRGMRQPLGAPPNGCLANGKRRYVMSLHPSERGNTTTDKSNTRTSYYCPGSVN